MSNILVTGASGFIGRALVAQLKSQGYGVLEMCTADGDISDIDIFKKFSLIKISHIFHLAGKTYVPDSWMEPGKFYQTNVFGTFNVLEFCKSQSIPLTFVSAYVYGHPEGLPIAEDSRISPSNPYALSKRLAEEACEFYARTYEMSITTIRPFNVYGHGQFYSFLIPSIIHQVLSQPEIRVLDLLPRRDYVYLGDLVDALLATIERTKGYNVYNIGSGHSMSVQEVVDAIQEVAGTNKDVLAEGVVRKNELEDVVADISNAFMGLGWQPRHNFKSGILKILSGTS